MMIIVGAHAPALAAEHAATCNDHGLACVPHVQCAHRQHAHTEVWAGVCLRVRCTGGA